MGGLLTLGTVLPPVEGLDVQARNALWLSYNHFYHFYLLLCFGLHNKRKPFASNGASPLVYSGLVLKGTPYRTELLHKGSEAQVAKIVSESCKL